MKPIRQQTSSNRIHAVMASDPPNLSPFEAYNQYLQTYTTDFNLQQQKHLLFKQKHDLERRIFSLEVLFCPIQLWLSKQQSKSQEFSEVVKEKPKRKRRLAEQIDKQFICPEERCLKTYGTLGSLQQHQRLKHPDLYAFVRTTCTLPFPEEQQSPTVKHQVVTGNLFQISKDNLLTTNKKTPETIQ